MPHIRFELGPYVVDHGEGADGLPSMSFQVPAETRPLGWRSCISLPYRAPLRDPENSFNAMLQMAGDADELYAILAKEIGGEPFRTSWSVQTQRSGPAPSSRSGPSRRTAPPAAIRPSLSAAPEPRTKASGVPSRAMDSLPPFLTAAEVCSLLRCSKISLWRKRKAQPAWLPAAPLQLGRETVFERAAVERALGLTSTSTPRMEAHEGSSGWEIVDPAAIRAAQDKARGRRGHRRTRNV